METVTDFISWAPKSLWTMTAAMKLKNLLHGRKAVTNILKNRHVTLLTKVQTSSQSYGFSSSHVWVWELDHKEGWAPKNWCLQTVVLEKTLESPLDCKEIKPVNPTGNQSWIFIGRTDAEAPILWPPDGKGWLIRKGPDAGKDWRQEEKGMTEDEMVGWHQRLDGHEFAQAPGWWRTGKPGMLQFIGSQSVGDNRDDWVNNKQKM